MPDFFKTRGRETFSDAKADSFTFLYATARTHFRSFYFRFLFAVQSNRNSRALTENDRLLYVTREIRFTRARLQNNTRVSEKKRRTPFFFFFLSLVYRIANTVRRRDAPAADSAVFTRTSGMPNGATQTLWQFYNGNARQCVVTRVCAVEAFGASLIITVRNKLNKYDLNGVRLVKGK